MNRLFGTDGVRGVANTELTAELALRLGMAGVRALSRERERPVFLIGRDTRISGSMLEDALSAGILAAGGDVIRAGVLPTPAVACLIKNFRADAGVVISASHNPFEYNGVKFFNKQGFKLDDALEDEIEALVSNPAERETRVSGDRLGRSREAAAGALQAYGDFLKATFGEADIRGVKLVIDCANGAASEIAERVFTDLGARVSLTGNTPDGMNINAGHGSTHPGRMQEKVLAEGADLGLAFDGDADRLIAADEKGRLIDGDKIMYICAGMLKAQGKLPGSLVTATVMSNIGLTKALEKIGCRLQLTNVGDRYVLEQMLKSGSALGGEQSGHIIFLDHSTTGDGILAALQLLKALRHAGRRASELADCVTIYPQTLQNARVKNENKHAYMDDAAVRAEIEKIEARMAGEGRVLIRPSGTEPLVRVMLEGGDPAVIKKMAGDLAALITEKLG
ncbi:MAG: phosphoglucosamine mutase [Clostridiales Family XIII bacterium]|jgi:phosphoglucosamine mutase|nr:phosphoglucosamine mutase [Clostridiales Family XIII bacterium]